MIRYRFEDFPKMSIELHPCFLLLQQSEMGNVSHKGRRGGLTKFQKRKLKYDFHTFFGKKERRRRLKQWMEMER